MGRFTRVYACLLAGILACSLIGLGLPYFRSGPSAAAAPPLAFTAYVGPGNPSGLRTTAGELGYGVTTASDYFDDSSWAGISDDQWDIGRWQNTGFRMTWGVPMLPTTSAVSLAVVPTDLADRVHQ